MLYYVKLKKYRKIRELLFCNYLTVPMMVFQVLIIFSELIHGQVYFALNEGEPLERCEEHLFGGYVRS